MSNYEVLLLTGTGAIILAVLLFFSAATRDEPIGKGLILFLGAGVVLYFANQQSGGGMSPNDIPMALSKLISQFS